MTLTLTSRFNPTPYLDENVYAFPSAESKVGDLFGIVKVTVKWPWNKRSRSNSRSTLNIQHAKSCKFCIGKFFLRLVLFDKEEVPPFSTPCILVKNTKMHRRASQNRYSKITNNMSKIRNVHFSRWEINCNFGEKSYSRSSCFVLS